LPVAYCREDVEADEEKIKQIWGRELDSFIHMKIIQEAVRQL